MVGHTVQDEPALLPVLDTVWLYCVFLSRGPRNREMNRLAAGDDTDAAASIQDILEQLTKVKEKVTERWPDSQAQTAKGFLNWDRPMIAVFAPEVSGCSVTTIFRTARTTRYLLNN